MNEVVMLVGLSGCGKSSIANEYRENGYEVFSSDKIREELWGDAADQQNPAQVFEALHKRIFKALAEGKNCVYDATNLSAKRRKGFLRKLEEKKIKCSTKCHLIIAPVEVCKERDKQRSRTVGENVIEKQLRQFEVPFYNEGWDTIMYGFSGYKMPYPEFSDFKDTEADKHDNPHHFLTISEHMAATAAYVGDKGGEFDVWLAAQFHDYGKYYTKTFVDRKGRKIDFAHFYNHQNVGAYYFLVNSCHMFSLSGTRFYMRAAFLIQHHMDHYLRDEKSMEKFYEEIGEEMAAKLKLLEEADMAAH